MRAGSPAPARGFDPTLPRLVGDPAARTFSTCTALVAGPGWVWDANGYYAALGVHPGASTRDLRDAYLRRGGHRSTWMTHALKQLLDRTVRRAYDRTPLGKRFHDRYVQERVWRDLSARARGDDDLLWRLAALMGMEPTPPGLDPGSLVAHDEGAPPQHPGFPYGYYLWRAEPPPEGLLSRWQDLLVRAASEGGVVVRVAVGVVGRTPQPWVHARVGYVDVLFVHEAVEPTETLARAAIQPLTPGSDRPSRADRMTA